MSNIEKIKADFFAKISKLKITARDGRKRILGRQTEKLENGEEVNVKRLLNIIKTQEELIDFMLDSEGGVGEHIQQLDNYRQLALKGLGFIASGHELNGLFQSLSYHVKNKEELKPLRPDINRLESIFKGHMVQHSAHQDYRMDKVNLKKYISTIFERYHGKEIVWDKSFDEENIEALRFKTDKGFTIMSNIVRNAMYWGDKVEIKWIDDKIIVSDNGIGVPKDKQNQLFNIGFSERPGGTGLGLMMSREYARENTADIYLDKENSLTDLTGASFVFDLKDRTYTPPKKED